jgi:hypothetical protein
MPTYLITAKRWNGKTTVIDPSIRYYVHISAGAGRATEALDRILRRVYGTSFNVQGGGFCGGRATTQLPGGHRFDWLEANPVATETGTVHGPATRPVYCIATREYGYADGAPIIVAGLWSRTGAIRSKYTGHVRKVYHRASDMYAILVSVDSKSRATIDHPQVGRTVVPCSDLVEVS